MTAPRRRLIVKELREQFHVSQRCASRALDLARSSLRYAPVLRDEQAALARRIEELAGAHPRYGYRRIWALLDREGWSVNKKAVRRIWRQSGLKLAQPQAVPKECAGNNFPVFPKYVIKPSAWSQTGRRAAWTPMHRKSNGG